tara:strand:- start:44 stop:193 length:150 start_codon:yes stop_codon:yes gene_type:complete
MLLEKICEIVINILETIARSAARKFFSLKVRNSIRSVGIVKLKIYDNEI